MLTSAIIAFTAHETSANDIERSISRDDGSLAGRRREMEMMVQKSRGSATYTTAGSRREINSGQYE